MSDKMVLVRMPIEWQQNTNLRAALAPMTSPMTAMQTLNSPNPNPNVKDKLRRGRFYSPRDWIRTTTEFNRDVNSGVRARNLSRLFSKTCRVSKDT